MGLFDKIKEKLSGDTNFEIPDEVDRDYLHVDNEQGSAKAKIIVRPFTLNDFEDVKPILDSLREGYTIPLINIKPLKDKDLVELKRVINKLKKTCDAIDGDIAGFGEDWITVVPSFAQIHREKKVQPPQQQQGFEKF